MRSYRESVRADFGLVCRAVVEIAVCVWVMQDCVWRIVSGGSVLVVLFGWRKLQRVLRVWLRKPPVRLTS